MPVMTMSGWDASDATCQGVMPVMTMSGWDASDDHVRV